MLTAATELWGKLRPLRPRFVLRSSVVCYRVLRVCVGRDIFEHFVVGLQFPAEYCVSL